MNVHMYLMSDKVGHEDRCQAGAVSGAEKLTRNTRYPDRLYGLWRKLCKPSLHSGSEMYLDLVAWCELASSPLTLEFIGSLSLAYRAELHTYEK